MKTAVALTILGILAGVPALAGTLATYAVGVQAEDSWFSTTGTVEAVRQGILGAQVSGRVTDVLVKNGDEVKVGQPLIQIAADEAKDVAAAGAATARGAEARLASAQADYERAKKLRAQDFISVAAMQRAESVWQSAVAESLATAATAKAAWTRAGWHTVRAPYSGHVMGLWVSAGDLATPGRPLVALYDPTALRVVAQVPETVRSRLQSGRNARVQLAGGTLIGVTAWRAIAAIDPATHSIEVRADLPPEAGLQPGQFAKVLLPLRDTAMEMRIPRQAIVHRSEMTGVYIVDAHGAAHLRQVRLGTIVGDSVTVLSGLQGGERIALDPLSAGTN